MIMKPFILSILAFLLFSHNSIQNINKHINNTKEATKVYSYVDVDQMPRFPDGESALMKHIADHLKYPAEAEKQGIEGIVILRFVVTATGEIDKVQILKPLEESSDREAIRVVKSLPKFIPGRKNGKPVDVYFQLPVYFVHH